MVSSKLQAAKLNEYPRHNCHCNGHHLPIKFLIVQRFFIVVANNLKITQQTLIKSYNHMKYRLEIMTFKSYQNPQNGKHYNMVAILWIFCVHMSNQGGPHTL